MAAGALAQQNILVLVADDLGVDNVGVYAAHPDPAHTPVLDSLAAGGMLFRNAYANPLCSPTRATILTGRYAHVTGMGNALTPQLNYPLPLAEVTLAEILPPAYRSAAVGKWHLSFDLQNPMQQGFLHHRGSIDSIPSVAGGLGNGYFDYWKNVDGVQVHSTTYATTETVDDALGLMGQLGSPWFLYVCFNAPHTPFHKPPPSLHTYNLPASVAGNEPIHSKAMIEAMDTEIGRLLVSMGPALLANTKVIFVGDNGPDARAVTAPWDPNKCKKTVYEGGIHVPLIVSGPGVAPGSECTALVNTSDLFATVADIAGVPHPTGVDSVSLVPYFSNPGLASQRPYAYTEFFTPQGFGPTFQQRRRAVREARYKLIYEYVGFSPALQEKLFFDLWSDPYETINLLNGTLTPAQQTAFTNLSVAMVAEGPSPWTNQGNALAGTNGAPSLSVNGSLVGNAPMTLVIQQARPSALTAIAVGSYVINAPFYGGVFVPAPELLEFVVTDPNGVFWATLIWPPGLPPFLQVTFQAWIFDPMAPFGLAGTNAMTGITPP